MGVGLQHHAVGRSSQRDALSIHVTTPPSSDRLLECVGLRCFVVIFTFGLLLSSLSFINRSFINSRRYMLDCVMYRSTSSNYLCHLFCLLCFIPTLYAPVLVSSCFCSFFYTADRCFLSAHSFLHIHSHSRYLYLFTLLPVVTIVWFRPRLLIFLLYVNHIVLS